MLKCDIKQCFLSFLLEVWLQGHDLSASSRTIRCSGIPLLYCWMMAFVDLTLMVSPMHFNTYHYQCLLMP